MSQMRTNRQRLTRALQDIFHAATDLKAVGYDPDGGIGLADQSEIKDAEHRLDEIALTIKMVLQNIEPVKTGKMPKWMSMKD